MKIRPTLIHAETVTVPERLEECFEDMLARARRADWRGCDATWDEFACELERHMTIAEQRLFPLISAEFQGELARDHAFMRKTLGELGVLVQLQAGHQAIVPAVEALRNTARRERAALYSSLRSRVAA